MELTSLLEELKNHIDITFSDEQYDKKLLSVMSMGASFLKKRIALQIDFFNDGYMKHLLFEYVRYSLSGAVNDFIENYKSELLSLKTYEDVVDFEITN